MLKKILVLIPAAALAVSIAGCGSNLNSDGALTGADSTLLNAAAVGISNCATCHSPAVAAQVASKWLNSTGKHIVSSTSLKDADSSCAPCHNQLQDGQAMDEVFGAAEGNVVSCESCHGGGQYHNGVAAGIPYPTPDYKQCGQCHDDGLPSWHPDEGEDILADFSASPHLLLSMNEHAFEDGSTVDMQGRCSKCHSDDGAKLYKNVTGGPTALATAIDDDADLVVNASPVQCRTCHNAHETENLLLAANENATGSAEFNTCTTCHQTADGYHGENSSRGLRTGRVIYDTHMDDAATTDTIEGYILKRGDDRVCRDCHNVHSADNTINDQWAQSAHGGFIKTIKDDAEAAGTAPDALTAGVTDNDAAAWIHYDWDATTEWDGAAIDLDRGDCQMCHTATGAANYLDNPTTYDPLNNDFSHLDGWNLTGGPNGETVSSDQNELLYCWGCHSDNSGGLRDPGAVSRPYAVGGTTVTLADLGKSNVCVNCHGARGNMEEYGLAENPSTDMSGLKPGFGPSTKNVTEAHYLVAAATVFSADTRIGYEYDGQDYTDVSYFRHSRIGTDVTGDSDEASFADTIALVGTETGPCVGCHMYSDESHLFDLVEKDGSGVITGLRSKACIGCHTGGHGAGLVVEDTTTENGLQTAAAAAAFLEEEAEGFHEALEILRVAMASLGVNFQSNYPYFNGASWINEGVFGAAHNYNYLHHEPGAYAHNRYYTKRLIFDSIDWADNYVLDGSITVDTVTYPGAAHWLGADETTGVATRP